MNKIEQGIDYIRTHGSATGEALAMALGCPKKNVQPMLYLAINLGYLATGKRGGANLYSIAEEVPEGQSWADFKLSRKKPKDPSAREKPPPKAKVIVEKQERTPAEVRNALADLFERRALGLPPGEEDTTTSESESATQGYEVIELDRGTEPAAASAVPTSPASEPRPIAAVYEKARFLFGCDGRLQVNLGDQRIICTREETAAVGRMMSALEPVWNV